ncbi:MAG: hypothetical protein EU539_04240 [Promethearchaeota archaeon]|nr:MAG: hypothetical protein EU539_04240 [Candidatus Lokiarchaeota archaeon]
MEQDNMPNKTQNEEDKNIQRLCEICLLYSDKEQGKIPILFCSDEAIKNKIETMNVIKYHSIWFLNLNNNSFSDNVDLEYGNKIYFAKKFIIPSKTSEEMPYFKSKSTEELVILVALPTEMHVFGDDLIDFLVNKIYFQYKNSLYKVLESEILRFKAINLNLISLESKSKIKQGEKIKKDVQTSIQEYCREYFSSVIKHSDPNSLKKQKALSFLSLKGIDVLTILDEKRQSLEEKGLKSSESLKMNFITKSNFVISKITALTSKNELEILIKNNTKGEIEHVCVKITYVKDYLEKEIFDQEIDTWYPQEDIIFTMPVIPFSEDYLHINIEGASEEVYLSEKIDNNTLLEKEKKI